MTGDDALRQVLARQLADALGHLAALLDLLDRKTLQISWRHSDRQVVEEARAFVEANG